MKKIAKWLVPILFLITVASAFAWILVRQDRMMTQLREEQQKLDHSQMLQALVEQQQLLLSQLEQLEQEREQMQSLLESNREKGEIQIRLLLEQILAQQEELRQLQATIDRFIQASQGKLGDGGSFVMNSSAQSYDYLAIGNSITRHAECDYWKNGQSGMGASTAEKDYFHQVLAGLTSAGHKVNSHVLSLYAWEAVATDRAQMATLADMYLTKDLDLVTIQLGENAQDLTTLEEDYGYLIRRIREQAPNARILVIGDFWSFEDRDEMKQRAAEQNGATFVSLREIMDDPGYQAGENAVFYDRYGNPYQVSHGGVAQHPSDAAMTYIAQAILGALKQ